jgi:hypothetical protein
MVCISSSPPSPASLTCNRQINEQGFANVVEAPAAPYGSGTARWLGPLGGDLREDKDRVYGIVYRLEKEDEAVLDKEMEERGGGYTKEVQNADFWGRWQDSDGSWKAANIGKGRIQRIKVVVYADRSVVQNGHALPGKYLSKLNKGIRDAMAEGIPKGYFEEYVRPFLSLDDDEKALQSALADAVAKGIDVRRLLERAESEQELLTMKANGADGEQAQAR